MTGVPPGQWPPGTGPGHPDRGFQDDWPQYRAAVVPKPSLPVMPTRYHGFWRTPRWAFWKPILGLVIGFGGFFLFSLVASIAALAFDAATGRVSLAEHARQIEQGGGLTPSLFTLNNLSLAACIPLAWAVGAIHGQRPGWMSSVVGRFRWRWFFACIGWLLPLWIVMSVVSSFIPALAGDSTPLRVNHDTLVMIAAVLLTTPLQCVGEEFGFRGLLNRAVASFVPQTSRISSIISALLGGAVSSVFFMLAHSAQDPWLNLFYFCFGAVACYMCHVSGGLEASSAMHIVNNMSSMVFLPFTDFSKLFDRSDGTGSPWGLIQVVAVAAGAAVITWRARRRGIVASAAPAAHGAGPALRAPARALIDPVPPGQVGESWSPGPATASIPGQDDPAVSAGQPGGNPLSAGIPFSGGNPVWQPSAPPIGQPWDEHGRPWKGSPEPDRPDRQP